MVGKDLENRQSYTDKSKTNMKCLCDLHEGLSKIPNSKEDGHVKFSFQAEEVLRGNGGLKRGD